MIRGVVLYSGSLASLLSAKLAERAGLTDLALFFFRSPFFRGEEHVQEEAKALGFSLRFVTVKRAFLRLPQGDSLLFPCRACRRILLARAARLFRGRKFDLLITGEIVGRGGLGVTALVGLDEELGLRGRVLRPLSARLLPPTWAEAEGILEREVFLDLTVESAEGRIPELACAFGLNPEVKGCYCLLRDPVFAQRCQLFARDGAWTANFLRLLEFPHLVPLGPGSLLVVALTPAEQVHLQELFLPEDVRLYLPFPGSPLGLLRAPWARISPEGREALVRRAASHLLALAGLSPERGWTVCFRPEEAEETVRVQVRPCSLRVGETPVK